jgi:hypothetical protein
MLKKILLTLSFTLVFLFQSTTVYAVTSIPSQNSDNTSNGAVLGTTSTKSFWDMIMDVINAIINAIKGIFIKTDITASPEETNQFVNDYTRSDKDLSKSYDKFEGKLK